MPCFRSSWLSLALGELSQHNVGQIAPFLAPTYAHLGSFRVASLHSGFPTRTRPIAQPPSSTTGLNLFSRRSVVAASSSRLSPSSSASNDTIFALATGAGRAGVAIIRISGPLTSSIYFSLCRTSRSQPYRRLPPSHKLVLRNIHHPFTGELLDSGAGVIHFPSGSSYTGEESLEMHIHGGSATIADVLDALGLWRRAVRLAEPGEFTRRAFENGRMDLASSEALGGLVNAETSVQRRVALQGTQGLQTKRFEEIREKLLGAMAMIEALIDFSDEEGVEEGTWSRAKDGVETLRKLLSEELGMASDPSGGSDRSKGPEDSNGAKHVRHVGEILTTGVRLAIYGPPNAGKSSLLNRLADRAAAIVSDIPGTTRDVLQVHLDLAGYKVIVYDTAGIREDPDLEAVESRRSLDQIERIGIDRAKQIVAAADLALLVLPAADPPSFETLRPDSYASTDPDLIFYNKSDLLPPTSTPKESSKTSLTFTGSVRTNTGIADLISSLAGLISTKYFLSSTEAPLITQSRHRFHLRECLAHVDAFQEIAMETEPDLVLAAEELRSAAKAVGKVTGRDVSPDEILGSIFATFCIGK